MTKLKVLILFTLIVLNAFAQKEAVLQPLSGNCITVTSSSEHPGFEAVNLINDKSFKNDYLFKNNTGSNMWISRISGTSTQAQLGLHKGPVWLLFEFDKPYVIDVVRIWNHNQNDHTRRGLKKVYIEYTSDGTQWHTLKDGVNDYYIIPESGGHFYQPADMMLNLQGKNIKAICITADNDYGNHYHVDNNQDILKEASLRSQNINYYALGKIRFYTLAKVNVKNLPAISKINFKASQGYLKSSEGPTREFVLHFDKALYAGGKVILSGNNTKKEIIIPKDPAGMFFYKETFTPGFMEYDEDIKVKFAGSQCSIDTIIHVPAARKWELHFLPHSHQDIGYTHRQNDVMKRQWDNLEKAVELSEKTKDYPAGSQYKWNSEATWSVWGYLEQYKGTEKAEKLKAAIKKGHIGIDAPLGSILTGICKQEELMHLFDDAHKLEKELQMNFNTAMFSDLPGAVWGMTTSFAQNGIRYFSSAPNYTPSYPSGGSRVGHMHRIWGDKPFYWVSPSGKDKVLHWPAGTGYSLFHSWIYDKLSVCGLEPIWEILEKLQTDSYPYPVTYMRYTIHGDNGPPDTEMPQIIRDWNEKYEYPKFYISTTKELFEDFERRYGDKLPVYSGDLSPYWEDGAASTARELKMNRNASEKLNQAEVLWSMFGKKDYPKELFDKGWKSAVLFSEHTWGSVSSYTDSNSPMTHDQWNEKKRYALFANQIADSVTSMALAGIQPDISGDYIHVINTNSWKRTDVVYFRTSKDMHAYSLRDAVGKDIPVQQMKDGRYAFVAKDVIPLGSAIYRLVKARPATSRPVYVTSDSINNGIASIKIDPVSGNIVDVRLGHLQFNYAGGKGLNDFVYTNRNATNRAGVNNSKVSILERGPVKSTIRVESQAPGCKSLIRDISLIDDISRVDIRNTVNRIDTSFENIRFIFPFSLVNTETNIDIAWGSIFPERQQLRGSNRNFFNVLNQVSVMNTNQGIVLTTPDAPFVELGDMTAEKWMTNTNARTDWALSALSSPTIYSWVMNNTWTTNYKASQPGITVFDYSISEFNPNKLADAKKRGAEAAQPLIAVVSSSSTALEPMFNITGGGEVVVSTVVPVQNGYFIRLFNQSDASVKYGVDWKRIKPQQIYESNNKREIKGEITDKEFWMKPYEVYNMIVITE